MARTKILNGVEVALSKEEEKEVEAQIVRDKERAEEYAKVKYRDDRRLAYPEIGDQLDDLFKQGIFSDEMSALIQQVKTDYPKPA